MHPWESEYRNPQFITLGTEPISDIRNFMKWLKKQEQVTDWSVFDAGCGNGKNIRYIIEHFCHKGIGYDISETAIQLARDLAGDLPIDYAVRSIGEDFDIEDASIDLMIDATSSHALNHGERGKFLSEISRVLKPKGYYFLRTLAIEGDTNAKKLIKESPGSEPHTYRLPGTDMIERVFSKSDIEHDFQGFKILLMKKTTGYQKWDNQPYRRNYWVVYLQKR